MALTETQIAWLSELSGRQVAKQQADDIRNRKDLLAEERGVKLGKVKESIKGKLESVSLKTGLLGSMKVLDEEGGQMAEFDYSDLKKKRQFEEEYLVTMREAMEQISAAVTAMRDARTTVKDEYGKDVEVPLYTDEQIAEEVYMPLVRERLMPEWLVPDKWSKTQEMLNASDALYKDRLKEYTAELEGEEQGLLDSAKTATTSIGKVTQKALALVPGGDAETASAVVGLVVLGTTTAITAVQALTKVQISRSINEVIKSVGDIVTKSIELGTGDKSLGEAVAGAFVAGANGVKMLAHLAENPPNTQEAIDSFSTGLQAAVTATFAGEEQKGHEPSLAAVAAATSAVALFKLSVSAARIRQHVLNGDSESILEELTEAAKGTLESVQTIVSTDLKEGKTEAEKKKIDEEQEALTAKIKKDIDRASKDVGKAKAFIDGMHRQKLEGMAGEIIDCIGDVLTSTLMVAAPTSSAEIGNAYRQSTSAKKVGRYMAMDPPEAGKAVAILGEGFAGAFGMAGSPALSQVGKVIGKTFVSTVASFDLSGTIVRQQYGDGSKALSNLARKIVAGALKINTSADPEAVLDERETEELTKGATIPDGAFDELSAVVQQALDGLNDEATATKLQKQVNELGTSSALEDIEASSEAVERILNQADQGGSNAADTRSIEILIKEMKRDRLIMEMALKLVSGGASLIEKVIPPMAIGGAAIKLAANLIKASQRAMALNAWIGNQKDLHKAVSSFESSAANFVKNQAEQFSHYAIQAALELARMIGEIVSCTGISSAAGVAIAKGAALAIVAEDISYQFYKKADLENAWRVTRKAWANPNSRKLGLMARKLNPTLAKYTLAWGATVKRDALAQEAMRSCGLNALTLSQKDSNVSQVQRYLEICFNEDNVVLKRYSEPEWVPGALEFTVKSWTTMRLRGETQGGVAVQVVGGLDESVADVRRLEAAFYKAIADIKKMGYQEVDRTQAFETLLNVQHDAFHEAVERLQNLMHQYQPANKHGQLHVEMLEVRDRFVEMSDELAGEIDVAWQEAHDAHADRIFREMMNSIPTDQTVAEPV